MLHFFHEYLYSVTLLLRKWKVQTSTTLTDFIYLTLTVKLLSIDSLQRTWQTQVWSTKVPINRILCYFRKAGKWTEVGVTNLNYFPWYKIYTPRSQIYLLRTHLLKYRRKITILVALRGFLDTSINAVFVKGGDFRTSNP